MLGTGQQLTSTMREMCVLPRVPSNSVVQIGLALTIIFPVLNVYSSSEALLLLFMAKICRRIDRCLIRVV